MSKIPIPLLLDTNILYRLISEDGDSPLLKRLEYHVQRGEVIMLCPEVLKMEWVKHRDEKKKAGLDKLKPDYQALNKKRAIKDPFADWNEEKINAFKNVYSQQYERVDNLLSNAIFIVRDDELLKLIYNLKNSGKAPFHGNDEKDHWNDAELIYSSLRYAKENNFEIFFFVSHNTKEFATKIDENFTLHQDINEFAGNIEVNYQTDIKLSYAEFDKLNLNYPFQQESIEYRKIKNYILVNRQLPLIDQVLEYLEKRFEDLLFLPKELFIEHYPFIVGDLFEYIHKPFALITDNKEIYDLLRVGGNPDQKKDADYEEKVRKIKQRLYDNHIYKIGFKMEKEIQIPFEPGMKDSSNLLGLYNNHQLLDLLGELSKSESQTVSNDIKKDLKKAYILYKVGNYGAAAELLLKIRTQFQNQNDINFFIVCFNLTKISKIVKYSYYHQPRLIQIAKECLSINLDKQKNEIIKPHLIEIVEYIYRTKFFTDNFYHLQQELNDIRERNLQQDAGSNQYTESMIEDYFATAKFLDENSIIYDRYEEYLALVSQYMEGLFASYGCSEHLNGKLLFFNDDLLFPIIYFAKPAEINDNCDRYKMQMAVFSSENNEISLYKIFLNLLDEYQKILETYESSLKANCPYFFDFYFRRFSNCLVIFSKMDIDITLINSIVEKLIKFLLTQEFQPFAFFSKWVLLFFENNQKKISIANLQLIFLSAIKNQELHDEGLFEMMHVIFKKRKLTLTITNNELTLVINNFISSCQLCNNQHSWHLLFEIYSIIEDVQQKQIIRAAVIENLNNNFDSEKYYLAVLGDISEVNEKFTALYIEKMALLLEDDTKKRISFGRDFFSDRRIDQFINFCFALDMDIPDRIKSRLSKTGNYYSWLIDMEGFNYNNFSPKWVHHHFTLHYKKKFRNSNALREHFLSRIVDGGNEEYFKFFIVTYC